MKFKKKLIEYVINEIGCFVVTSHKGSKSIKDPSGKWVYPVIVRNGKHYKIHRFIYEQCFGEIPKGLIIRHTCDNPLCINPEHLKTGTRKENTNDMIERNRAAFRTLNDEEKEMLVKMIQEGISTQKEIAEIFNVNISTVRHYKRSLKPQRKNHGRPKVGKGVTDEQKIKMKELRKKGIPFAKIAAEFGVSPTTIKRICKRD
jgi:transposase-like protein